MIQLILLLVGYIFIHRLLSNFTTSSPRLASIRALMVTVGLIVMYNHFSINESFLFQVSPSVATDRCDKGYSGMPVGFQYDGDNTRFRNCSQAQNEIMLPMQTSSYKRLDDTYSAYNTCNDVMESFRYNDHNMIDPNQYNKLDTAYTNSTRLFDPVKQPPPTHPNLWAIDNGNNPNSSTESFCGACVA